MCKPASRCRGISRVEILMILVCLVVLLNIAAIMAQEGREDRHPNTVKDATQQAQIHKAIVVFSRQFNGRYPTPGSIDPLPFNGVETPGLGAEDVTVNTTANLYSSIICQNFFTPELVVSPVERNPNVKEKADYNYEAYNPIKDSYWDATFAGDLETGSNASFAHMPIFGKRGRDQWRDNMDSEWPVFSDRGPRDGKLDPASYTTSPHGQWAGVVVYNDGHWEFEDSTHPDDLKSLDEHGVLQPDNLFAFDDAGGSADRILAFTKSIKDDEIDLQFD